MEEQLWWRNQTKTNKYMHIMKTGKKIRIHESLLDRTLGKLNNNDNNTHRSSRSSNRKCKPGKD